MSEEQKKSRVERAADVAFAKLMVETKLGEELNVAQYKLAKYMFAQGWCAGGMAACDSISLFTLKRPARDVAKGASNENA